MNQMAMVAKCCSHHLLDCSVFVFSWPVLSSCSYLGGEVPKNQPAACSPWAVSTPCRTCNTNSTTKHLIKVSGEHLTGKFIWNHNTPTSLSAAENKCYSSFLLTSWFTASLGRKGCWMKSCSCYFSKICGIFHTPTVNIRELTDAGMALQQAGCSGCITINLEDTF